MTLNEDYRDILFALNAELVDFILIDADELKKNSKATHKRGFK